MNETNENVQRQKPKNQTPRRLGLGLRSPRNCSTLKTPSTSNANIKLFHSPVIDEATPNKKHKNDSETIDVEKSETFSSSNIRMGDRSTDEIQMKIKQMECRLAKYEQYEKRTNELDKMIQTWRAGGQMALQMLQDAITPKQDLAAILNHLNLPEHIFDVKQIE